MLRWPRLLCAIVFLFLIANGLFWTGLMGAQSSFSAVESPQSSGSLPPDSSLLGVVWSPPSSEEAALQALQRIHDTGATAVRLTHLPKPDTLFARADSLGLHLFVDLPVTYQPASTLRTSLEESTSALDRVLALARQHASVRYVGLAQHVDTTVPSACEILEEWTDHIHAQSEAGLSTYYVTPFVASADRCAEAVDLPLPDVRGHSTPVARWQEWQEATTDVGLGALGTWVRPDAESGLQAPHSPERQARYLERALSQLLDSTRTLPSAIFVYRWRDPASPLLPSRRYGLHEADGTPRPAASVVQGRYTDTQQVFAFPSGPETPSGPHTLLILGWGLIAVLGGLYTRSSFIRNTLVRYFTAHGFYRDSLRRGRKVEGSTHGILLILVALAVGIILALAARGSSSLPATEYVLAALPSALRSVLVTSLETPLMTGILLGSATLVLLFFWTFSLTVVAQRWTRFSFSQGLMLVAWPCWPALPAMIIALVAATHPPFSPDLLGVLLLTLGGLATLGVTLRVLIDYQAVTELPFPAVVLLGGLSPIALCAGAFTYLLLYYEIDPSFVWRLATLT